MKFGGMVFCGRFFEPIATNTVTVGGKTTVSLKGWSVGGHPPHVANIPNAAMAMTKVASQPKALRIGGSAKSPMTF